MSDCSYDCYGEGPAPTPTFLLILGICVLCICCHVHKRSDSEENDSSDRNTNTDTNNANRETENNSNDIDDGRIYERFRRQPDVEANTRAIGATTEASRSDLIRSRLVFQKLLSFKSNNEDKDEDGDDPSRKSRQQASSKKKPKTKTKKKRKKKKRRNTTFPEGDDSGPTKPSSPPPPPSTERNTDEASAGEIEPDTPGGRNRLLLFFHNDENVSVEARNVEKEVSEAALNDQTSCSICVQDYGVGDVVVRLRSNVDGGFCNHCFHEDCLIEWLECHDECPVCRVDMIHSSIV